MPLILRETLNRPLTIEELDGNFTFLSGSIAQGTQGPAGATGAQGPAGATGATGADGTNGTNGTDGATGAAGADGTNGTDGAQGPAGATGLGTGDVISDGSVFTDNAVVRYNSTTGTIIQNSLVTIDDNGAITAPNNTSSMIPFYYPTLTNFPDAVDSHGAVAHAHNTGKMYYAHAGAWHELANMTDIIAGTNGSDGNGITSTTDNGNGTFTLTYDDGTDFTTVDLTGPQGPDGPAGVAGTNGTNGINGTNGSDGNGITSTIDNGDGTFTFEYADGSSFTTSDLTGLQGDQGDAGPIGLTGAQGPQGNDWTGGTNYILVKAEGTDIENAAELQAAYDLAISMSATAINRITIIASPGYYNSDSNFLMDTQFIDLVSLDGNRSIIFNGNGTISITSTNTLVRGVDVLTKPFKIGHNLLNLVVENCRGGDNSFGYADSGTTLTVRGTFIDCVAGDNSFGHRPNIGGNSQINLNIGGTFTNCTAGNNSFGYNTNNQVNSPTTLAFNFAKLTNCIAGINSFGVHISPTAGSVTQFNFSEFTNCKSGNDSFGYRNNGNSTIQSTLNLTIFENCKGGNSSFCTGLFGTSVVIFKNCEGGISSFVGDGTLAGNFENCVSGDGSFGNFETASGTFTNCVGGFASFGNFGVASGTFTNCIGGLGSFGGDGTLTGRVIKCQLTSGTFQTPTVLGIIMLSIDGNDDIINLTA